MNKKSCVFNTVMVYFTLTAFILSTVAAPAVFAQSLFPLPAPGAMVNVTPAFTPCLLKGMKVFPDNPFRFDFIIDPGEESLSDPSLNEETTRLIKYFLASLTVPEEELWVNLSPYEEDRIISEKFGVTEMGRDLLAQDYLLKQLTATLFYPEKELGAGFWKKVHARVRAQYGKDQDIPMERFDKVWIIPEKAVVYTKDNTAFVTESRLRVMLEEDYASLQHADRSWPMAHGKSSDNELSAMSREQEEITKSLIKEIILPEIEKEVNEGKSFAPLRQIYHSLILARWFKQNIKESLLSKIYVDQSRIAGVDIEDPQAKDKIYAQYIEAFKTGVYDYIKEEYDPAAQEVIPRHYFSGGLELFGAAMQKAYRQTQRSPDHAMLSRKMRRAQVGLDSARLDIMGRMKKPSPKSLVDFSPEFDVYEVYKEAEEQGVLKILNNPLHKIKSKLSGKNYKVVKVPLKSGPAFYYHRGDHGWIVLIDSSLTPQQQEEAEFHEATEIELINKEQFPERPAHILASALQRIEFSKNGELTSFDEYIITTMSLQELEALRDEYQIGRQEHHEVLKMLPKINLEFIKNYEKKFYDKVAYEITQRKGLPFAAGPSSPVALATMNPQGAMPAGLPFLTIHNTGQVINDFEPWLLPIRKKFKDDPNSVDGNKLGILATVYFALTSAEQTALRNYLFQFVHWSSPDEAIQVALARIVPYLDGDQRDQVFQMFKARYEKGHTVPLDIGKTFGYFTKDQKAQMFQLWIETLKADEKHFSIMNALGYASGSLTPDQVKESYGVVWEILETSTSQITQNAAIFFMAHAFPYLAATQQLDVLGKLSTLQNEFDLDIPLMLIAAHAPKDIKSKINVNVVNAFQNGVSRDVATIYNSLSADIQAQVYPFIKMQAFQQHLAEIYVMAVAQTSGMPTATEESGGAAIGTGWGKMASQLSVLPISNPDQIISDFEKILPGMLNAIVEEKEASEIGETILALAMAYPVLYYTHQELFLMYLLEQHERRASDALAMIYPYLDEGMRWSLYQQFKNSWKPEPKFSPTGHMGMLFGFFNVTQQKEMYKIWMECATDPVKGQDGRAVMAREALGRAMPYLDEGQRKEAYQAIKLPYTQGAKFPHIEIALASSYYYVDFDEQQWIFNEVMEHFKVTGPSEAVMIMLPYLGTAQRTLALQRIEEALNTGLSKFVAGGVGLHFRYLMADEQAKFYPLIAAEAKVKDEEYSARVGLGAMYAMAKVQKAVQATLMASFITSSHAGPSMGQPGAPIAPSAQPAFQAKGFIYDPVEVIKDMEDGLLSGALNELRGLEGPAEELPVDMAMLSQSGQPGPMISAENLKVLAPAYRVLGDSDKKILAKYLLANASPDLKDGVVNWALAEILPYLEGHQKEAAYLILKETCEKQYVFPSNIGKAFGTLNSNQQKELFKRWMEMTQTQTAPLKDVVQALGLAFQYFSPNQRKVAYEILKKIYEQEYMWSIGSALAFTYPYVESGEQSWLMTQLVGISETMGNRLPLLIVAMNMPQLQQSIWTSMDFGKALSTAAVQDRQHLAVIFASLPSDYQEKVYPLLKKSIYSSALAEIYAMAKEQSDSAAKEASGASFPQGHGAKMLNLILGGAMQGAGTSFKDILSAAQAGVFPVITSNPSEITDDMELTILPPILKKVVSHPQQLNDVEMIILAAAYPALSPVLREHFKEFVLAHAHSDLKASAVNDALAQIYPFLSETEQQGAFKMFLAMSQANVQIPSVLGKSFGYFSETQRNQMFKAWVSKVKGTTPSLWAMRALAYAAPYLSAQQLKEAYVWVHYFYEKQSGPLTLDKAVAGFFMAKAYPFVNEAEQKGIVSRLTTIYKEFDAAVPLLVVAENASKEVQEQIFATVDIVNEVEKKGIRSETYTALSPDLQSKVYPHLKSKNSVALAELYVIASKQLGHEVLQPTASTDPLTDYLEIDKAKKAAAAAQAQAQADLFGNFNTSSAQVPQPQVGTGVSVVEEYNPVTGQMQSVGYELLEPTLPPPASPEAQRVMALFSEFENENFKVLTRLKEFQTVGQLFQLLAGMERMIKLYLHLFKKQDIDRPLQEVATDPNHLVGGRAVAQIFLRIQAEVTKAVEEAHLKSTDTVPQTLRKAIQAFDDKKSTMLQVQPAESYNSETLAKISFAELVNVVHQKGIRNLSSIEGGGKKTQITVAIYEGDIDGAGSQTAGSQSPPGGKYVPPTTPPPFPGKKAAGGAPFTGNQPLPFSKNVPASLSFLPLAKVVLESTMIPNAAEIMHDFQEMISPLIVAAQFNDIEAITALAEGFSAIGDGQRDEVFHIIFQAAAHEALGAMFSVLSTGQRAEVFQLWSDNPAALESSPMAFARAYPYFDKTQKESDFVKSYIGFLMVETNDQTIRALGYLLPFLKNPAIWQILKDDMANAPSTALGFALAYAFSGLNDGQKKEVIDYFDSNSPSVSDDVELFLFTYGFKYFMEHTKKTGKEQAMKESVQELTNHYLSVLGSSPTDAEYEAAAELYPYLTFFFPDQQKELYKLLKKNNKALAILSSKAVFNSSSGSSDDAMLGDSAMLAGGSNQGGNVGGVNFGTAGMRSAQPSQNITINYVDARAKPDKHVPIGVRYVAEAFAKGQAVHEQARLYNPANANILADDHTVILGMQLGVHSARIQFAAMPVQEGGRVVVNYSDSGGAAELGHGNYEPGSSTRLRALEQAFKAAGFKVTLTGYTMEAVFDKDNGASNIGQLPEKLEFAIQVLSGTKDFDIHFNSSSLMNDPQAIDKIAHHLIMHGYLPKEGRTSSNGLLAVFSKGVPQAIINLAQRLGLDIEKFPRSVYMAKNKVSETLVGQRALDMVNRQKRKLLARGAIAMTDQGWTQVEPYAQAAKGSRVRYVLSRLESASEEDLKEASKVALVAQTVRDFSSVRVIGTAGNFMIEEMTLPIFEDENITFYLLKDSQTEQYQLGFAVLGDFFVDLKREDLLRKKSMPNNALSLSDLKEILTMQRMQTSERYQAWLKDHRFSEGVHEKSVFSLLEQPGVAEDLLPKFSYASLSQTPVSGQGVSSVSIGGVAISSGVSMGRVIVKGTQDAETADYSKGVLVAESTDPEDDDHIKASRGLVVTTGGPLSHAAIRSREHQKPALILNGGQLSQGTLTFDVYHGSEVAGETTVKGKNVSYLELSDYQKEEIAVSHGDLVLIDAARGQFFVIARSGDITAQQIWEQYESWKQQGKRTIQSLIDVLSENQNENLIRAVIYDLLYHSVLSVEDVRQMTAALSQQPAIKTVILSFLRRQAAGEISCFREGYENFKIGVLGFSLEELLLQTAGLVDHAERVANMVVLANGDGQLGLSNTELVQMVNEIKTLGQAQLKEFQGQFVKTVQANLKNANPDLLSLLRLSNNLKRAGLSLEKVSPELFQKFRDLQKEREDQVRAMAGRGILWKEALHDRFSRPVAGGKGAHSGEIITAIEILKKAEVLPENLNVTVPAGFIIQEKEYESWNEQARPHELDKALRDQLVMGYRDLVLRQARELVEFLEKDERTDEEIKGRVRKIFEKISGIKNVTDGDVIDSFVGMAQSSIEMIFATLSKDVKISRSLKNRLVVFGSVAARSSGVKEDSEQEAMAGMKTTVLNVSSTKKLFGAVIEVWKSGAEGVLVEEMINAKHSVLAFSADPVTNRMDHIRISAANGLAEGLVAQKVQSPDAYVIQKNGFTVVDSLIGEKKQTVVLDMEQGGTKVVEGEADPQSVLSSQQIEQTARVVEAMSKFFGFHVDVEASFDTDDRLVLLQVRPITTIRRTLEHGLAILQEGHTLDDQEHQGKGAEDHAMLTDVGGINLSAELWSVEQEGEEIHFDIDPALLQEFEMNPPEGFIPVIFNMVPVNVPLFLGLNEDTQEKNALSLAGHSTPQQEIMPGRESELLSASR